MLSSRMSELFARWLVRVYPRAWRARYEDEFVAVLETGVSWRDAADVLFAAPDAWITELLDALRGPGGESAKAVATYVAVLLVAFAVMRVVAGPGRVDLGLMWALAYGAGYVVLCLVLRAITRSSRRAPM